jgi:hypothetical protein
MVITTREFTAETLKAGHLPHNPSAFFESFDEFKLFHYATGWLEGACTRASFSWMCVVLNVPYMHTREVA